MSKTESGSHFGAGWRRIISAVAPCCLANRNGCVMARENTVVYDNACG